MNLIHAQTHPVKVTKEVQGEGTLESSLREAPPTQHVRSTSVRHEHTTACRHQHLHPWQESNRAYRRVLVLRRLRASRADASSSSHGGALYNHNGFRRRQGAVYAARSVGL
jgi:hypothetical protein